MDAAASAGKDALGGLGGIFEGMGKTLADTFIPPVEKVMKEALKDVKIENVTLNNLNMDWNKLIPALLKGATTTAADSKTQKTAAGGTESGPVEMTGTISLLNLAQAVVSLIPKSVANTTPGMPGVAPTPES